MYPMLSQILDLGLDVPVTVLNEVALVQVSTRLSLPGTTALKETFEQLCRTRPALKRVILDLSKTDFIDSSSVDILTSSREIAQFVGIELILWSVCPQLMSELSLQGLDQILTIDLETEAISPTDTYSLQSQPVTTHLFKRSNPTQLTHFFNKLMFLGMTAMLFTLVSAGLLFNQIHFY